MSQEILRGVYHGGKIAIIQAFELAWHTLCGTSRPSGRGRFQISAEIPLLPGQPQSYDCGISETLSIFPYRMVSSQKIIDIDISDWRESQL